jgi:hypothetical protein
MQAEAPRARCYDVEAAAIDCEGDVEVLVREVEEAAAADIGAGRQSC